MAHLHEDFHLLVETPSLRGLTQEGKLQLLTKICRFLKIFMALCKHWGSQQPLEIKIDLQCFAFGNRLSLGSVPLRVPGSIYQLNEDHHRS